MQLKTFKLERYFAEHEFTARHLLSPSDCESMALPELLALADDETRALWDELWLGYTESAGHPLLREEIAGLYGGLTPDDMLVAAPEEAIFILMNALLEPGDEVVAHLARVPVAGRGRAGDRLRGRALAAAAGERQVGAGRRRAAFADHPADQARHRQLPAQPDRLPARPRDVGCDRAAWRAAGGCRCSPTRCTAGWSTTRRRCCRRRARSTKRPCRWAACRSHWGCRGCASAGWRRAMRGLLAAAGEIKDYTTICSSAPSEVLALIALRARERLIGRNVEIVRANLRAGRELLHAPADEVRVAAARRRTGRVSAPAGRRLHAGIGGRGGARAWGDDRAGRDVRLSRPFPCGPGRAAWGIRQDRRSGSASMPLLSASHCGQWFGSFSSRMCSVQIA